MSVLFPYSCGERLTGMPEEVWVWLLEHWRHSIWPLLLVVDALLLRLFDWGLLKLLGKTIRFTMSKLQDTLIGHLEAKLEDRLADRLVEVLDKKLEQKWEVKLSQKLNELNPPPPTGISGTPCPRSGLYWVQELAGDREETFEEGDLFPPVEISGRERKVTWVYRIPPIEPPERLIFA